MILKATRSRSFELPLFEKLFRIVKRPPLRVRRRKIGPAIRCAVEPDDAAGRYIGQIILGEAIGQIGEGGVVPEHQRGLVGIVELAHGAQHLLRVGVVERFVFLKAVVRQLELLFEMPSRGARAVGGAGQYVIDRNTETAQEFCHEGRVAFAAFVQRTVEIVERRIGPTGFGVTDKVKSTHGPKVSVFRHSADTATANDQTGRVTFVVPRISQTHTSFLRYVVYLHIPVEKTFTEDKHPDMQTALQIPIFTLAFLGAATLLAQPSAQFVSAGSAAGIDAVQRSYGVSAGDFDGDGWDDLYISRHFAPNLLYRNLRNGTYEEIGASMGVDYPGDTWMATWGDYDGDGDLDLYLGNRNETNVLYRNDGSTFTDISETSGANLHAYHTRAALAADVDLDGDLDLYCANLNHQNELYLNNGDGTFVENTYGSGAVDQKIAMGSVFFDYDNDGDQDLYLTHDADQANILYQNDGMGNFVNVAEAANADVAANGMGVDVGDINNDGWMDLYITNLSHNNLLLNLGPDANGVVRFQRIGASAGVQDLGMGWGTTFIDYDNDGYLDIYCVNDSNFAPNPNLLYRNNGDLTFSIVSENTPLTSMNGGYGTVATDANRDGRLDLVVCNAGTSEPNELFFNQEPELYNFIGFRFRSQVEGNTHYVGARVRITDNDGVKQIREITAGMGFASQNSTAVHFGLGTADAIQSLEIALPGQGFETVPGDFVVNAHYLIEDGDVVTVSTTEVVGERPATHVTVLQNPVYETLKLRVDGRRFGRMRVEIYNMEGRRFQRSTVELSGHPQEEVFVDIAALNAGAYTLVLQGDFGEWSGRIVVL